MGYKNVCLTCRKAFNMGTDNDNIRQAKCPECGDLMTLMNHRFRPPKKDDIKKWDTVRYLVQNGFVYQHVYAKIEMKGNVVTSVQDYVRYPETLKEAEEFVKKYKRQALKDN